VLSKPKHFFLEMFTKEEKQNVSVIFIFVFVRGSVVVVQILTFFWKESSLNLMSHFQCCHLQIDLISTEVRF
jgi:hypothetical protein